MIPSHEEISSEPAAPAEPLGRAWIGPAMMLAGGLSLARAEVLVQLGVSHGADSTETATWVALAEWPALLVQSMFMAAAAVLVVWSSKGARLLVALVIGALFVTSAVSGWPVAPVNETLVSPIEGLPGLAEITLAGALALVLVAVLAWSCRRNATFNGFVGSVLFLVVLALPAIGLPGYLLWQNSLSVPQIPIREVVAQLHGPQYWSVVNENSAGPARRGLLNPFMDVGFKREEHDTFDKTALLMSPPCEVTIEVPRVAEGATLSAAAQIAGRYTNRGPSFGKRPSELDGLGLNGVSVRFEALLDGASVFDSTIQHLHEDQAADRVWKYLDLDVAPGQVLTLRTEFGDEASARAFRERELQCGFGDLMLDRWSERPRTHASPEEPNILFITIDTLRADRLSCYGYEKPTTPYMDALAREGMLFERAFATSSWTWPSTASLFTGLSPYEHGVLSKRACNLNYPHETLAEALQARGFTTAAVSANPLIDRTHQFDQGFESFEFAQHLRMGDEVIDGIESKLRELANSRFYFYVHLVDPHTPHEPLESELKRLGGKAPEDFENPVIAGTTIDGMDAYAKQLTRGDACDEFGVIDPNIVVPEAHAAWISDRYDASVGTADHYVGRILTLLSELGLAETTVIALTSDHGEELLDHNMYGHGHTVHRELVQVPLLLAGPGIPGGVRVKTEVSNRHLAPTLARIAGTKMNAVKDAVDLLNASSAPGPVFYQASEGYWNGHGKVEMQGLRGDDHVLHYAKHGGVWEGPPTPQSRARLFHIESDFFEHTNLAVDPRFAKTASALAKELMRHIEEQKAGQRGSAVGVGEAGLRVLKDLGYVGEDETLDPDDAAPKNSAGSNAGGD